MVRGESRSRVLLKASHRTLRQSGALAVCAPRIRHILLPAAPGLFLPRTLILFQRAKAHSYIVDDLFEIQQYPVEQFSRRMRSAIDYKHDELLRRAEPSLVLLFYVYCFGLNIDLRARYTFRCGKLNFEGR